MLLLATLIRSFITITITGMFDTSLLALTSIISGFSFYFVSLVGIIRGAVFI